MPSQPHILMCPPDFYGIHYEINPWMNTAAAGRPRAGRRAVASACADTSSRPGRSVSLLEAGRGLARPGVHGQRGDDLSPKRRRLSSRASRHPPAAGRGAVQSPLAVGERLRSRRRARRTSASRAPATRSSAATRCTPATACGATRPATRRSAGCWACRVIPVELVDARYYHLDTCFCPLADGEAIWYPPAFDDYGQRAIREHVRNLIEVERSRGGALRVQRGGDRPHGDHQHRLRPDCTPRWPRAATNPSPRRSTNSSKPAAARSASRCDSTAKRRQVGDLDNAVQGFDDLCESK